MQKIDFNIILASSSPRRSEILQKSGIEFKVLKIDFKEEIDSTFSVEQMPLILSINKMNQCPQPINSDLIITCDTLVSFEGKLLGKPQSNEEAIETLKQLSSNKHQVISGVSLATKENRISFNQITEVSFDYIPEQEIKQYVKTKSPFDKAGSYGIQDDFGLKYVKSIHGCYYNVMGLPINKLTQMVKLI